MSAQTKEKSFFPVPPRPSSRLIPLSFWAALGFNSHMRYSGYLANKRIAQSFLVSQSRSAMGRTLSHSSQRGQSESTAKTDASPIIPSSSQVTETPYHLLTTPRGNPGTSPDAPGLEGESFSFIHFYKVNLDGFQMTSFCRYPSAHNVPRRQVLRKSRRWLTLIRSKLSGATM